MTEPVKGTSQLGEKIFSSRNPGKSSWRVQSSLSELVNKPPMAKQEVEHVRMLKLKSNYARNRTVSVGDFYLLFNGDGETEVPEHYRDGLELEMSRRPGRYRWVTDEPTVSAEPTVVPEPEVVEEPSFSLEKEIEEVLETEETPLEAVETSKPKPKPRTKKSASKRTASKKK